MKKGILLLLLIISYTVNAQKLKDLLYSGKLKSDSGTVIKKSDDLSTKIDTSSKKPAGAEIKKMTAPTQDSSFIGLTTQPDSISITEAGRKDSRVDLKDNTRLWKEFADSVTSTLNTEVMPSKKIKKGSYFVLVDYEIGLDGQVTIKNVFPSPENTFLEQQVKERFSISPPRLNPVISSNGKPRKVIKRYTVNLSK